MPYTSELSPRLLKRPQGVRNRAMVGGAGIIGIGVLLTYAYWSSLSSPSRTNIVNEFVTAETGTGTYQVLAGAMENSLIFSLSGGLSLGQLTNPFWEFSATGSKAVMNRITYNFPATQGSADDVIVNDGNGNLTWTSQTGGSGGGSGITLIQENDANVVGSANTIDFLGADFNVTESPNGEGNISLANPLLLNLSGATVTGANLFTAARGCTVTDTDNAGKIKCSSLTFLTGGTVFGGDVTGTYNATAVGDDSHNHTNSTITLASTDLTDSADLLYETELDIFSELQTQIADKTLVNKEDAVIWDAAHIFSGNATVRGVLSGATLNFTPLKNCNTIDTDANGTPSCGTDEGTAYSAGKGLTLAGSAFSLSDTITGSTLFVSGSLSSSGALSVEATGSIQGNLTVGGSAALQGATVATTLSVTGNATFSSDVHVTQTLSVSGATSIDGALSAQGGITGNLTGNADTATALVANPTDCAANQYANTIDSSGNLTCSAISDADVPDTITVNTANSGDSATAFFSSGLLEMAIGGTNANLTAVQGGVIYSTATAMAISAAGTQDQVLISNGTSAPSFKTLTMTGAMVWYLDGGIATGAGQSAQPDAPYTMTLKDVVLNIKNAPTGAALIVDINDGGTTVFTTRPQIADGATAEDGNHVFSDTTIAKGSKVTMDVDQVGSTATGTGMTVELIYTYTP